MTESSGRLDPLQSYPAITIPSFLWGNTQGQERKLDQILLKEELEWQWEREETEPRFFFLKCLISAKESASKSVCLGLKCSLNIGPKHRQPKIHVQFSAFVLSQFSQSPVAAQAGKFCFCL